MDTKDFQKLADRCLDHVANWLENFDPDEVDFSSSDGVLTLEFSDGQRFVLNRQTGAHQMWFAAGARAWHYDWNSEISSWQDDRDQHDLFQKLSEVIAERLGREVEACSAP